MIRLVTRLAHSRANVRISPPDSGPGLGEPAQARDWTLLPVNARRRYRRLIDLQPELLALAEQSPFNSLTLRGPKGILATGLANNYVGEVIGPDSSYSVLKVCTYPVPTRLVRDLVAHCDEVLVIEEGYPLVERKLVGLLGVPGKTIRGRLGGGLPPDGELTADLVRRALGMPVSAGFAAAEGLPPRPPQLCKGCPHCDTFGALLEAVCGDERPLLFSDIGCYTLGALPPFQAVHTCVDMGASISMAVGAAKAGARRVVCTIGDSTFVHSGMTPLIGAVHDDADITVMILDNALVGMTGGQEVFATGESLLNIIRGLGVDDSRITRIDPSPRHHAANVQAVREAIERPGLSVVVACRPCIHARRKEGTRDVSRLA